MRRRRRCRYVFPWQSCYPDNRCVTPTLLGLCRRHLLERLRWEHHGERLHVELDLSMLNLPTIDVDSERPRQWMALSWGTATATLCG